MKKQTKKYKVTKSKTLSVSENISTYNPANNYDEVFQKVWATLSEVGKKLDDIAERQKKFEEEQEKRKKEWEEYERRKSKEWEEYKRENRERIKQLDDLFNIQWGKLVEALLGPGCKKVFGERGIDVHYRGSNFVAEIGGEKMEVDVLLENEKDVVVVEIKTTARVKQVKEVVEEMKKIKRFFPRFEGKNVYGAIAALKFLEESDKYAASQGLFVIEPSGDNMITIKNKPDFQPKKW